MKNQRGFSLVQVIISLGLLSGLFVAAMKLVQKQTQLGESSSFRFEALMVTDEIKSILADPASCRSSLGGKSAVFDDIDQIKTFDPAFKETVMVYGTYQVAKRALGQKDVYLNSMSLSGSLKGFTVEKGYTTLSLSFSDRPNGGNFFQTMFPIKAVISDMGRITSCQASPGLHQEKSIRTLKDPWIKIYAEKEESNKDDPALEGVAYQNGPVVIGRVPNMGSLNVEGGVLLFQFGEKGECSTLQKGDLIYSGSEQRLFLCSELGNWEPLNGDTTLFKTSKRFTFKTSKATPVSQTTPEKYSFCRLEKMEGEGGQCTTSAVNRNERQVQWEMVGQHFRGRPIECNFICYR